MVNMLKNLIWHIKYRSVLSRIYWRLNYLIQKYITDRSFDWYNLDFYDSLATFMDKSKYIEDYIIVGNNDIIECDDICHQITITFRYKRDV